MFVEVLLGIQCVLRGDLKVIALNFKEKACKTPANNIFSVSTCCQIDSTKLDRILEVESFELP